MLLSILLFIASIPLLAEPSAGDTLLRQEMLKAERLADYTYLIAAMNYDEEVAFIHIHDTVFSLLPTSCPIPTTTKWGRIKYQSTSVTDTQARCAYLVGTDTTGRVYVIAVEYDLRPAPVTLYYTDPLPEFGNTTPILTPDGELIVTGAKTSNPQRQTKHQKTTDKLQIVSRFLA